MNSVSSKESAAFKPKRRANPSIAMATPKAEKQQVRSRSVSPAMSELDEEGEQVDVTSSPVLGDGLAGSGKRGRSNSREQDPEARPNNKDKTSVSKIRRSTSKLMNCSFSIRSILQSDSTETPAGEPNPQPLAQQSTQEAIYSYLASQKQQQQQATNFLAGHSVPPLGEPMSGLYPNLSNNHLPPQTQNESPTSGNSPLSSSSSRQSSPTPSIGSGTQGSDKLANNSALGGQQQQQQQQQSQNRGSKSSGGSKSSRNSGSTNHLLRPQICTDPRLAPFECHLDNLDLWHRFHPLDTEMIITKQGRRMFPPVRVTFSMGAGGEMLGQLNPRDKYQVLMDILPYDNKRYRYAYHKSSWQQAGKADPPSPTKLFLHPDGPFTLDQLKRQVISFEKIKLTNNDANKHGYIVLNSMHKYQPRIHLVLWRGKESQNLANSPIANLDQETHKTFIFSETIFTAVTAYQNHSITKLKIDSNPFAKGFRDSSRLTDLELESMQDLMSDGQCPFSPPRAPPPGFQHFLFAAAAAQHAATVAHQQQQQQQHHHNQSHSPAGPQTGGVPSGLGPEDPTSVLLRERTLMSLDSFLQQQHHQQQQQHFSQHQLPPPPLAPNSGANNPMNHQHHHLGHLQSPACLEGGPPSASPTSGGNGRPSSNSGRGLDCSLSNADHLKHHLIGTPPTSSSSSSFQGSMITAPIGYPVTSGIGHPLGPPTSYNSIAGMNPPPPPPPPPQPQGLPLNFGELLMQQQQFAAAMAAGALNPQQLQQAFMAAHHQQQMASLSMHLSSQQQRNGVMSSQSAANQLGGSNPIITMASGGGDIAAKAQNLATATQANSMTSGKI